MANFYSIFKKLLPQQPLLVGTIVGYVDGIYHVELLGGGRVLARGTGSGEGFGQTEVGAQVFVRDDVIEGVAAPLEGVIIEV